MNYGINKVFKCSVPFRAVCHLTLLQSIKHSWNECQKSPSNMCPCSTKAVIRYICSDRQQYIVWVKIIYFSFMPKIIRILRSCSMKIFSTFPTVNISKLNFWLLICIAKNFIWTTLKMIFSIFRFFCTLRFQIYKYCPIITNIKGKLIYSAHLFLLKKLYMI